MNRSIHIGTNYANTPAELFGCERDAMGWESAMRQRGFSTLGYAGRDCTKANIVGAIRDGIAQTERGEWLIVTFSGHGTFIRDTDGDEPDGFDEAICPHDMWDGNLVTDDELFDIFNERERGSKVLFISDSCHSGTIGRIAPAMATRTPRIRFFPPRMFLPKEMWPPVGMSRGPAKLVSSAPTLSGCKDTQFSYDAWFGDEAWGAMTYNALAVLGSSPAVRGTTLRDFHRALSLRLPSANYPQSPQLSGTSSQKAWRLPF